ncbi:uncharacterized protein [Parasteatoda tepidariorum]|uniref:uncharacterized protein n=1 Tax=Parasteatoda tepidariorum TaxID=114398 RepID=UPI001C71A06B|nr:uncharacterized protein LOC107446299 [Parasteatoda tepidariorum]
MKVMFTVLCLTFSINSLPLDAWSCTKDPRTYTIEEMTKLVYAVANDKGVPPTVIVNRILRKVRYRQRNEKARQKSQIQQIALKELLNNNHRPPPESTIDFMIPTNQGSSSIIPSQSLPPPLQLPPTFTIPASRPVSPSRPVPLSRPVPPSRPMSPPPGQSGMLTGVLFSTGFSDHSQSRQPYPQPFYIPVQNLRPPPGVTVRVKSGVTDGTLPDVVVTLSPMMTIVEVLKQAESKFRSLLGISSLSEDEVITFSRSSIAECYVIEGFNGMKTNSRGYWKIVVYDRNEEVVYDSVCLPSRNEVPVKPGMTITLLYSLV